MNRILVDTSIWSEVLRRRKKTNLQIHQNLENLIMDNRAVIIGPIRQELLSGIRKKDQFERIKESLLGFDDNSIIPEMYILAAEFNNVCRSNGIQGSHIDFFICSFAHIMGMPIYTLDKDFYNYQKYLDISLYNP